LLLLSPIFRVVYVAYATPGMMKMESSSGSS
jgi:hypothetical protein